MKTVVLAFSGGIGTTACLDLLRNDHRAEVITVTANLGQRAQVNCEGLFDHAHGMGVARTIVSDLRETFVKDYVWPTLRAGAIYQSGYMLSSALARPAIVSEVVRVAKEHGTHYIAHGCAAKSNDQIRFVNSAASIRPGIEVISPLRDAHLFHAEDIVKYLRMRRLPWKEQEGCFSITENIWGTTFQWAHVPDPFDPVPESHYRVTTAPEAAPDKAEEILIHFEEGVPTKLNEEPMSDVVLLETLARVAGEHGIGRVDTFEDRMLGIKTRDVYEQPAATVLHAARESLERLVLSHVVLQKKRHYSQEYAELIYQGKWFSEQRDALDAYFDCISYAVTGDVKMKLYKGQASLVGVRSENSLYSQAEAQTYSKKGDKVNQRDVAGFMNLTGKAQRRRKRHPFWSREQL